MKLVEFPEYVRVAQLMWDRGLVPMSGKYLQQVTGSSGGGGTAVAGAVGGGVPAAAGGSGTPSATPTSRTSTSTAPSGGAPADSGALDWYDAAAAGGGRRRRLKSKDAKQARRRARRRLQQLQQSHHRGQDSNTHSTADQPGNSHSPDVTTSVAAHQKRKLPGRDPPAQENNIYRAPMHHALTDKEAATLPKVPYNGTIFLTTEDPKVIADANAWGARNHWTVVYTNLFDR
jgi:hypothetical protein